MKKTQPKHDELPNADVQDAIPDGEPSDSTEVTLTIGDIKAIIDTHVAQARAQWMAAASQSSFVKLQAQASPKAS